MVVEKEKEEWQNVDSAIVKLREAGPRSSLATTSNDTHSPTDSTSSKADSPSSYTDNLRQQKINYKLLFEKAEKLQKLKEALKEKRLFKK